MKCCRLKKSYHINALCTLVDSQLCIFLQYNVEEALHTLYNVQCNMYTMFRLRAQGQCIALWMREDNKSRGCCWAFHCKATTSYYYSLHRHHCHHDKDTLRILWSSLPSLMFSKKNNAVLIKNNTDTETDSSSTAKM